MNVKKFWLIGIVLALLPVFTAAQEEQGDAELLDIPEVEISELSEPDDLSAEDEAAVYPPPEPFVSRRPERGNRKADWASASRNLDYSADRKKPQKKEEKDDRPLDYRPRSSPERFNQYFSGLAGFVQALAILAAAAGIGYALYYLLQQPRNKQISQSGVEITWENLDQFLDETRLESFLQEAIRNKAWAQAVRVYFLMTIQSLSARQAIVWARHKTNRTYLNEMRNHPLWASFREATLAYEQIWYGNKVIDEATFRRMEPGFKSLITGDGSTPWGTASLSP